MSAINRNKCIYCVCVRVSEQARINLIHGCGEFFCLAFFLEWTRSQKSRTPNNLKEKWSWPRKQQSNIFCVRFGNFIYTIAISGFRAVSLFFCRSALILIYLYFFFFHLFSKPFNRSLIHSSLCVIQLNECARVCVCWVLGQFFSVVYYDHIFYA